MPVENMNKERALSVGSGGSILFGVFLFFLLFSAGSASASGDTLKVKKQEAVLQQGILSLYGKQGHKADVKKARVLFEKAASEGSADAFFYLGVMAQYGYGETRDIRKAEELYLKGAAAGSTKAQMSLGQIYQQGALGKSDPEKALKYYMLSAEGNDPKAMNKVGDLYLTGVLVPFDGKKALYWYEKASKAGNRIATRALAKLALEGRGDALVPDYRKALDAYQLLAKQNDPEAFFRIGMIYGRGGHGVKKDGVRALEYLQKAADAGYTRAFFMLGALMINGDGIPADIRKGIGFLAKAAESDDGEAAAGLSVLFREGKKVPVDLMRAFYWAEVATALHYRYAPMLMQQLRRDIKPEQITTAHQHFLEWEARFKAKKK